MKMHATALACSASLLGALLAGCERPPVDTEQVGYRGLGMETVSNPRIKAEVAAANQLPPPIPPVEASGPRARDIYKNVPLLGDLTVPEFTRIMLAITQWVAPPEQSCTYCHEATDLASDAVYTKVVSRRMIEMTRHINANWQVHVAETGVTCFTCHGGQIAPTNMWYESSSPTPASHFLGNRAAQNAPADSVGLSSLPNDPSTPLLQSPDDIRIVSETVLPAGNRKSIKQTELTYGLMMEMSQSLGVNCTTCHNSRSFADWDSSTPAREIAWHALRMVREVNTNYVSPLASTLPAERLGPHGDVGKVNCATCHQGLSKPLNGASLLAEYPALAGPAREGNVAQRTAEDAQAPP